MGLLRPTSTIAVGVENPEYPDMIVKLKAAGEGKEAILESYWP